MWYPQTWSSETARRPSRAPEATACWVRKFVCGRELAARAEARLGTVTLPLDSAVDGDVVNLDAAFGEQLFDVAVRQAEAQVPTDGQDDHVGREAEPSEGGPGLEQGEGDGFSYWQSRCSAAVTAKACVFDSLLSSSAHMPVHAR
jgi:hypothetical protein